MTLITTLVPKEFWFRTWLLALVCGGLTIFWLWNQHGPVENESFFHTMPILLLILSSVSAFDLFVHKRYRLSYDDSAVYSRNFAFKRNLCKEISLPYKSIFNVYVELFSEDGENFQTAIISSEYGEGYDIRILRPYIADVDLREFLTEITLKSDAVFDESILKFVNNA